MTARTTPSRSNRYASVIGTRLNGSPLVVLLDIDGTLAPIAPRPADARIPDATRVVLDRLTKLPNTVLALVTGRSAEDAARMAVDDVWIIGNHGLELRSPNGIITVNPDAARYEPRVASAVRELMPLEQKLPGVLIENKRWGLSVHYRLANVDVLPSLRSHVEGVAKREGLRVTEGKKILELRPPGLADKGTATIQFIERVAARSAAASVLYAGDDRTDEDAIRALRAGTRQPNAVTARVDADADGDLSTDAELVLASPDEVRELLEWVADRRGRTTR
jgi:trehalose-phosphatase